MRRWLAVLAVLACLGTPAWAQEDPHEHEDEVDAGTSLQELFHGHGDRQDLSAQNQSRVAMMSYYTLDFFSETWRQPGADRWVLGQTQLILLLDGALLAYVLWRARRAA